MYRVNQTLDRIDVSSMELLYIDETLSKKGHNYVTVVCNQDRLIIFICEGKSSETVDRLAVWLEEHNRKKENIGFVSYNLEEAYPFGVRCNFPNARIVYNEFHAVNLIVETINDTIQRAVES